MENGAHNVSFTCYFAPSTVIRGKCFIDFLDGTRNITIEADTPADITATHFLGILAPSEYRINVHDVFSNGTVQKGAIVIHTSFSIPLPSTAAHTQSTGIVQDYTVVLFEPAWASKLVQIEWASMAIHLKVIM